MTTKNIYLPLKTSVRSVREVAKDVKLISLVVPGDFTYDCGQFVMASVMGAGEVPLSITSTPGAGDLDICIRRVGSVTSALTGLTAGDEIWVRGPYGKSFPVDGRRDTLFICGGIGIVPLRPLINRMTASPTGPAGTRRCTVIYGSRNPSEVLFRDEVLAWQRSGANVILTVDCDPSGSWDCRLGLVTDHLHASGVDFRDCTAYLCGPHVMIQAVMRDLSLMGVPADRIITTLEAHMKCGVGKCGHCYCGGKLICEDGPVFSLEEIRKYNIRPGVDTLG